MYRRGWQVGRVPAGRRGVGSPTPSSRGSGGRPPLSARQEEGERHTDGRQPGGEQEHVVEDEPEATERHDVVEKEHPGLALRRKGLQLR
jgi:hypothetical protein